MAPQVSIIGSGNAGLTAAYHFSLQGANVCLFGAKGFDQPLADIEARGGIEALSSFNDVPLTYAGFQKIDKVTRELKEAIATQIYLFYLSHRSLKSRCLLRCCRIYVMDKLSC